MLWIGLKVLISILIGVKWKILTIKAALNICWRNIFPAFIKQNGDPFVPVHSHVSFCLFCCNVTQSNPGLYFKIQSLPPSLHRHWMHHQPFSVAVVCQQRAMPPIDTPNVRTTVNMKTLTFSPGASSIGFSENEDTRRRRCRNTAENTFHLWMSHIQVDSLKY